MNTNERDERQGAPERVFLKACHPASPNHNCSWGVSKTQEDCVEYVRADLVSRASVAAVEGDVVQNLVAVWRARADAMEPEVNRTWDDDGALRIRTIRQLADELAAVLPAAASSPASPQESPRCPKCGYVMCQQFDSRPVNALADIATPNGKYVCYHCAPVQPEGEQADPRGNYTDGFRDGWKAHFDTATPPDTPVVAREVAEEWFRVSCANVPAAEVERLAAVITRYYNHMIETVAAMRQSSLWNSNGYDTALTGTLNTLRAATTSPLSETAVGGEAQDRTMFIPPAEDALHVAICQAVQEHHGPSANAILRAALNDYKPTQLTRMELIRVQQRSGSGEVTAVMVSRALNSVAAPPEDEQEPSLEDVAIQAADFLCCVASTEAQQLAFALKARVSSSRSRPAATTDTPVVAREVAEEIVRQFNLEKPGWVTVGRITVDCETETERFERTTETATDRIAAIITRHFAATEQENS